MNDTDKIQFDTRIRQTGGSIYLLVPPEVAKHLDLSHGQNMKVQAEVGKHGRYLSAWRKDQRQEFRKASKVEE